MEPINRQKGPWTVKSSQVKYQNPWIKVQEDQVIRPDGQDGIWGVVTVKPGSAILPVDSEKNVYLIEEYHYALEKREMLVPTGGVDDGETPLEAAKRELEEEAGLQAQEWLDYGVLNPLTMFVQCPQYLFVARQLNSIEARPEGGEDITIHKMPFQEAYDLVLKGELTHGPTVSLILRAKELLDL